MKHKWSAMQKLVSHSRQEWWPFVAALRSFVGTRSVPSARGRGYASSFGPAQNEKYGLCKSAITRHYCYRRDFSMASVNPNFRVSGTVCAPLTPFTADGELNLDAMPPYNRYLDTHDIDGAFILGTMGEGMSLTLAERKLVAEYWVQAGKNNTRLKTVIVHVGAGNLKDSIELAKHAEKIGATAIACLAPSYNKPPNEEVLVRCMKQVAAAAPNTPFYYYDINFMTGIYLNTSRFLELAADEIPTLRGAKVSSRELPALTDCTVAAGGRFQIMIGTDEQLLTGLALGVEVPISNSYLGGLFRRLKAAFDAKDMDTARKEQLLARKLQMAFSSVGGGPAAVKSIMRCLGVDLGSVRLPLVDVPTDQEKKLCQDLKDIGFIDNESKSA